MVEFFNNQISFLFNFIALSIKNNVIDKNKSYKKFSLN